MRKGLALASLFLVGCSSQYDGDFDQPEKEIFVLMGIQANMKILDRLLV